MIVLSLGTDRKLFEETSEVRSRQHAYADICGEIHILVGSTGKEVDVHEGNLHVYSTHSYSRFFYVFGMMRRMKQVPRPDVITVQDPFETGLAGLYLSWKYNVPLHVQVHTDPCAPEFARTLLNRVRRFVSRFVLRHAMRIRVVSERVKDSVGALTSVPITVLPIYTDLSQFEGLIRTKHPRFKIAFLCVGRFEHEKRFDRALDALSVVRKNGHDAGLTLMGAGSEEESLRAYAEKKGVAAHSVFAKWATDIRPHLREADALLVPSEYEGYGMVIVEALAAGVPVIARDVGVAREAGALVVQGDFSHGVLSWVEKGSRMGELALALPRSFDEYVATWANDVIACVGHKKE